MEYTKSAVDAGGSEAEGSWVSRKSTELSFSRNRVRGSDGGRKTGCGCGGGCERTRRTLVGGRCTVTITCTWLLFIRALRSRLSQYQNIAWVSSGSRGSGNRPRQLVAQQIPVIIRDPHMQTIVIVDDMSVILDERVGQWGRWSGGVGWARWPVKVK